MAKLILPENHVKALDRAADILYDTTKNWIQHQHPIDRLVTGNTNKGLETSINFVINNTPLLSKEYALLSFEGFEGSLIWLGRDHIISELLGLWISQYALTRYAMTSSLDHSSGMIEFEKRYAHALKNPSLTSYNELRDIGYATILTRQFDKFMELYNTIRKPN